MGCDEREQTNGRDSLLSGYPGNLLETSHMKLASRNVPRDE